MPDGAPEKFIEITPIRSYPQIMPALEPRTSIEKGEIKLEPVKCEKRVEKNGAVSVTCRRKVKVDFVAEEDHKEKDVVKGDLLENQPALVLVPHPELQKQKDELVVQRVYPAQEMKCFLELIGKADKAGIRVDKPTKTVLFEACSSEPMSKSVAKEVLDVGEASFRKANKAIDAAWRQAKGLKAQKIYPHGELNLVSEKEALMPPEAVSHFLGVPEKEVRGNPEWHEKVEAKGIEKIKSYAQA